MASRSDTWPLAAGNCFSRPAHWVRQLKRPQQPPPPTLLIRRRAV